MPRPRPAARASPSIAVRAAGITSGAPPESIYVALSLLSLVEVGTQSQTPLPSHPPIYCRALCTVDSLLSCLGPRHSVLWLEEEGEGDRLDEVAQGDLRAEDGRALPDALQNFVPILELPDRKERPQLAHDIDEALQELKEAEKPYLAEYPGFAEKQRKLRSLGKRRLSSMAEVRHAPPNTLKILLKDLRFQMPNSVDEHTDFHRALSRLATIC